MVLFDIDFTFSFILPCIKLFCYESPKAGPHTQSTYATLEGMLMVLIFLPGISNINESLQHVFVKNCLRETARLMENISDLSINFP